jgi:hypothetical protein
MRASSSAVSRVTRPPAEIMAAGRGARRPQSPGLSNGTAVRVKAASSNLWCETIAARACGTVPGDSWRGALSCGAARNTEQGNRYVCPEPGGDRPSL